MENNSNLGDLTGHWTLRNGLKTRIVKSQRLDGFFQSVDQFRFNGGAPEFLMWNQKGAHVYALEGMQFHGSNFDLVERTRGYVEPTAPKAPLIIDVP